MNLPVDANSPQSRSYHANDRSTISRHKRSALNGSARAGLKSEGAVRRSRAEALEEFRSAAADRSRASTGWLYVLSILTVTLTTAGFDIAAYGFLIAGWLFLALTGRSNLAGALGLFAPFMFYFTAGVKLNVGLIDLVLPALIILMLVKRQHFGGRLGDLSLVAGYVVPLLCWLLLSGLVAFTVGGRTDGGARFIVDFFKLLVCLALFSGLVSYFATNLQRKLLDLLYAWSVMATATALASIYEMMTSELAVTRVTGGFEDPNLLGFYFVVSLCLGSLRSYIVNNRIVSWHTLLLTIGVLATASRGSLIAVAVMGMGVLVVYLLTSARKAMTAIVTAVVLSYLLVRFGKEVPALGRLIDRDGQIEDDIRLDLWAGAIDQWYQSPVLGIGLGQYSDESIIYTGASVGLVAHNTFLSFLAETGIPGLLLFCSAFIVAVGLLVRGRGDIPGSPVLLIGWVGVLTNMFAINSQNARFVWVFLAVSVAYSLYFSLETPADGYRNRGARVVATLS